MEEEVGAAGDDEHRRDVEDVEREPSQPVERIERERSHTQEIEAVVVLGPR